MSTYKLNISGNSYDVKILSIKNNQAEVDVNGMTYSVDVAGMSVSQSAPAPQAAAPQAAPQAVPASTPAPAAASPKAAAPKPAAAGANDVTAPMPGSIINILVSEGDSVNAGDPVLIMEAMKMENEVSAAASGTVTAIHVNKGETVEQGAPLMSIG